MNGVKLTFCIAKLEFLIKNTTRLSIEKFYVCGQPVMNLWTIFFIQNMYANLNPDCQKFSISKEMWVYVYCGFQYEALARLTISNKRVLKCARK